MTTETTEFEIREQVRLPLRKCAALVLSGIQFRLFRASITVAIVALAVAFLMTIVADSLIGREVGRAVLDLTAPRRELLFWLHRLSVPMTEADLAETLGPARPADARWEEIRTWGGADETAMRRLQELIRREKAYLGFFEGLSDAQRRRLAGRARGRDVFAAIGSPEAFESFVAGLRALEVSLPTPVEDFRRFLAEWRATAPLRERILQGQSRAWAAAAALRQGRSVAEFLAGLSEAERARLVEAGFRMDEETRQRLRSNAALALDALKIESLLRHAVIKQRFAIRQGIKDLGRVHAGAFFAALRSRPAAEWLVALGREIGEPIGLAAERIVEVAGREVERERLSRIESALAEAGGGPLLFGFSTRAFWLILVSLIVCAVGIANAMLMSVTERFKEIATMKCLGATDGFILLNFLLESGLQGLTGGAVGGLLGVLLGVARAGGRYGALALRHLPPLPTASAFLLSVAVGIGLSILAAIYPAGVAARLAPMEAMRVE